MRAIVCNAFTGPGDLTLTEIEGPEVGREDLLISVYAAAVCFVDLLIVQGQYQIRPSLPFVPGSIAAGVVRRTGADVTAYKSGDRVVAGNFVGAFAEELVVPATRAYPLPDGVSFEQGAACRSAYGVSYFALTDRSHLEPGETLVVHGAAGGLGLAAVELGKVMGATVIGTVGSSDKTAIVHRYGADHVFNYSQGPWRDNVNDLTDGLGADVIFDVVGGNLFEQSLRCMTWNGRLLVLGFTSGQIPTVRTNLPLLKNYSIIGVNYGAWLDRNPEAALDLNQKLLGWTAQGRIRPYVSHVLPIDQAGDTLRSLAERRITGKAILRIKPH